MQGRWCERRVDAPRRDYTQQHTRARAHPRRRRGVGAITTGRGFVCPRNWYRCTTEVSFHFRRVCQYLSKFTFVAGGDRCGGQDEAARVLIEKLGCDEKKAKLIKRIG